MRYRYITAKCTPDDPIHWFRLVSHRYIGLVAREAGRTYYRIHIPDDLKLTKYSCDEYSTTEDVRRIKDFDYDIMMTMWDGKRKVISEDVDIRTLSKRQFYKWLKHIDQEGEHS